jgi:outer membrane receptor protein involved in Fe transport
MNKYKLFFFLLFTCFILNAQKTLVTLQGKIIEEITNVPLEYATVVLKNTNTNKVSGGITDGKGNFSIETETGTFTISFEYISFKTKSIENAVISANKDFGTITLSEDAEKLQEIVIVAEKSTVDIRLDKKIYNVGKDMTVKGGNASDVLDNVPSVNVDVEGNVSLRGSENVRILIDGKPSALVGLSGAAALRQLPADAIERVEVITSPSARYDSEGTAGIINIVLRKGKATGLNGSVGVTIGNPESYRVTTSINSRSEKTNFFTTLGYDYSNGPGIFNSDVTYLTNGTIDSLRTENRDLNRLRSGVNANIGLEYYINKKSSLTGSIYYRNRDGNNYYENNIKSFDANGTRLNTFTRIQDEDEIDETIQFSVNYVNNINDKGQKLTMDFQHSVGKEDQSAVITDINNETNTTNELEIENLIQLDYVLPIGENTQFEAGYRGNFEDLSSKYMVVAPNLAEEFNPSNTLSFVQNVHAFYTQFGSKINQFSYLLGLRSETTLIDIDLLNTNESFLKNYTNLFPTVNLGYEISDDQNLTLGYSRRLSRPRSYYLNPFENRSSETIIRKGNVDLNPTYTNSFDLGYLNTIGKLTLNSSIYYQHSTNTIERVARQEFRTINGIRTSVLVSEPINIASEDRVGFELTANYNPTRKIRLSGSFNFFQFETAGAYTYTVVDSDSNAPTSITQNFDNKNNSWFTRFNARVTLPAGIEWQTRLFYSGPNQSAQTESKGILSTNLAFSKEVLKDKGTLVFNVSDLFNSRKRETISYTPSIENPSNISNATSQWRVRQISLNFTYRFNQKKQKEREGGGENNFEGGEF